MAAPTAAGRALRRTRRCRRTIPNAAVQAAFLPPSRGPAGGQHDCDLRAVRDAGVHAADRRLRRRRPDDSNLAAHVDRHDYQRARPRRSRSAPSLETPKFPAQMYGRIRHQSRLRVVELPRQPNPDRQLRFAAPSWAATPSFRIRVETSAPTETSTRAAAPTFTARCRLRASASAPAAPATSMRSRAAAARP